MTERLKRLTIVLAVLVALLVVADRVGWGAVSQWREDQSTNLWLGYTRSPLQVPVGLMSSIRLPNPNGMILFSELLSRLPNPWFVSALLGILQAGLLAWVCWHLTRDLKLFAIALGPLLTSVLLRGASVELVQHWILILVNCLFFAGILIYLRSGTLWVLPLVAAALLLGPSIYLAGAVNTAADLVILLIVILSKPPRGSRRAWLGPVAASVGIVLLSAWLTWLPFFQTVGFSGLQQASGYSGLTLTQRLSAVGETIAESPYWSIAQIPRYGTVSGLPPLQVDPHIVSPRVYTLYDWTQHLLVFQGVLCYLAVASAMVLVIIRRRRLAEIVEPDHRPVGTGIGLLLIFVVASYALAPLLGGAVWAKGQRLDEAAQFVPFLMIAWFMLPPLLELPPPLKKGIIAATLAVSLVYTGMSALAGVGVVRNNLSYRGRLIPADVPLVNKMALVDFIARDWQAQSASRQVPVAYDIAGLNWAWIPSFGQTYLQWYPAPYTLGRTFDFLLLREYGLVNTQEGIQLRSLDTSRYVVTYAFAPKPVLASTNVEQHIFGRLRLTVVLDLKPSAWTPPSALVVARR